MCWAFPQGEWPKVPSTMFERNLFLNPVIRITTVIMVFVDIKMHQLSQVGAKHPKPKACDEKYSQNSERSPQAGENKSKSTKMLESSPQVRESDKKLMHKQA